MKKIALLLIALCCTVGVLFAHRTVAQDCSDMSAYMINAAGECVNLDTLQQPQTYFSVPRLDGQDDAELIPDPDEVASFPPQANLTTIVVDTNTAFLQAIQRLKAGDRVLVKNGTYQAPEGREILVTAQGNPNNWIVIAAFPGDRPVLQSVGANALRFKRAAYVEIRGFEVVGADTARYPSSGGLDANERSHHIRMRSNFIHDIPGDAIGAGHADYIELENNTVYNSSWGWIPDDPSRGYAQSAIGLYQMTDADQSAPGIRNIVRGNVVFDVYNTRPFIYANAITDGNCFILDDTRHTQEFGAAVKDGFTAPYTGTTLVENNLCVDNGGRGIHVFLSDNVIARNNTLYKNNRTPGVLGELSVSESGNVGFYNNIIHAAEGSNAIINDRSTNVQMRNNLLFGTDRTDANVGNLIKADPEFVNPSTDLGVADFSLQPGSPAIGVGDPANCAATYFDGTPRNGVCNLGAFAVER
jgi:parallel beta-helix repeat protein